MNSLLPLIFWLALLATPALAETRVFDLQHRRAEEVATTLQDALGSAAKVVPVRHSLLVSAPSAELAMAAELIALLDRPARMLRVYVTQDQQDSYAGSAIGGSVAGRSGDATIVVGGRPVPPPRGGATVVVGGEDGVIAGTVNSGRRIESHRAEQFLVTLEGSPARISVGQRLPFNERWLVLARRHLQVVESTRYETVDTGFEVTPTLLPTDQVALTIQPFMAFVDPRNSQQVRFSNLSTQVTVPVNTWFDLAGTMSSHDEVSREILGAAQGQYGESGSVRVRVELQAN